MVLTKKLFNFTCDSIKDVVGNNFKVEYDQTIAGNRIFSATQGDLVVSCTKSTRDLEPTYLTIAKRFEIQSPKDYEQLTECAKRITKKGFETYIEPEGNLETINVYKNPQKYNLKDEHEAIDALIGTGKKTEFSVVVRFNSKKNNEEQIKRALNDFRT